MTFEECELTLLRAVVDKEIKLEGKFMVNNPEIKRMIQLLEDWLKKRKNICYGGTALNAVLPKKAQFYNRDFEIPDYDFFSPFAMKDAIELSKLYYKHGFKMVEAKSGVHHGTYKVYVNFLPIADITQLDPVLYENMKKETVKKGGIHYAPIHFLQMACFTELSRPKGDVSRWEKVFKRLTILNHYYPLKSSVDCMGTKGMEFQRPMSLSIVSNSNLTKNDGESESKNASNKEQTAKIYEEKQTQIYTWTRDALIKEKVVFFGGFATSVYAEYMSEDRKKWAKQIPDFDVLSENAEKCVQNVTKVFEKNGVTEITVKVHDAIGEIVPRHYQISVFGTETICFVYEPIACHSYNTVSFESKKIKIATIDTMLSLYLAFIYTGKSYFLKERIVCMAQFLFDVEQENRLEQKGALKRFTMNCIGKQNTLTSIREMRAIKFQELHKKNPEYYEWFLKYNPAIDPDPPIKQPVSSVQKTVKLVSSNSTSKSTTAKSIAKKNEKKHTKKRRKKPKKKTQKLSAVFFQE